VKVADTGIGLSAEDQARLFQEFVRIKNSKTQDIRGTGLGLVIVKKLVELYQGTVSVESEPDTGTTFSLILFSGDLTQ
jgi:Signal transduction histidine kinase